MIDFTIFKPKEIKLELDRCKCEDCGKVMLSKNAIPDFGYHDGWEMQPYTEYLCPYCETGYIIDFWPSNKAIKEYENEQYKSKIQNS